MGRWKGLRKFPTRIVAGVLALCIVVTMFPITVFADNVVHYGNVNQDEIVDEKDVEALKKYLTEYKNLDIDKKAADVNVDKVINLKDLLLLEQKVAGLNVILGESVTVTFDSKGGTTVEAIRLCKGATLSSVVKEVPTTQKAGAIFAGWYVDADTPLYGEDVLNQNITVYAKFEEVATTENLTLSSFALEEQKDNLSFTIIADRNMTVDAMKEALSLLVMDGTDPIELEIIAISDREFTVKAKEGFTEGASYQLVLSDGLQFKGKEKSIHTANFTIDKEEVDSISYNENIIYIKDTEEMSYQITGSDEMVDVLEATILSNTSQTESVTGSFAYTEQGLEVGDILCIYENTHPRDRDYTRNDYNEDAEAYVEVTAVSDLTISFQSINEENADKVFFIPDSIPFSVKESLELPTDATLTLPTGDSGTVSRVDYDEAAWTFMGKTETPKVNVGDFVVFYEGEFSEITVDTAVYYGEVTKVDGETIYYKKTTAEAIAKSQELYLENTMEGDELLKNVDSEVIEEQVEKQALESGFAEEAANYLAEIAQQTDGFKNMKVRNMTARTSDGRMMSARELSNIGGTWELAEDVKVTAVLGKSSEYFRDGISLALRIDAEFTVDIGDGGEMKIDLSATFIEEIAVDIDISANAKVTWYVIVPVFDSLRFGSAVDIKNYSAISLDVKIYTVEKEEESIWKKLKSYVGDSQVGELLEKAEELKEKIEQVKETSDKIHGYKEDLEKVWAEISKVTASGGEELTQADYETMLETLGQLNVTSELTEMLHLTSNEEMEAGTRDLMERYSEMLETESDWITLIEQEIFAEDYLVKCFAIGIKLDFVVKANVNIALGVNLEYVVGKRYSFWIDIIKKTSGSSTMDLLDEKFAFQFYVMGALGIKMGVKAEIKAGLFSTKVGSIGVSAEFGPYLKLWGYFIYEYTKMRPANTNQWNYDERMLGALYLEFGLYMEVAFNAQVLDGRISYNPTLYDQEFPLLTAGNRINHYDFGYAIEEDEVVVINDEDGNNHTGITMELPETYRQMKYIDLVEGDFEQEVCSYDNFIVTLSNRNFQLDKSTGDITVNVPEGVQYMKCDLTLTWKLGKLEFSSRDISVTIPLVWTSLSTEELNQRFTATVKVGNAEDGYTTVWSKRVKKNAEFDLPTHDEVLELVGYENYNHNGENLKFEKVTGYGSEQVSGLTIYTDTTYYFEADLKEYTLTIKGVEKTDGTKENRTFEAYYGEHFNIEGLDESGTSNSDTGRYTAYLSTEANQNGKVLDSDLSRVIDNHFARELQGGTIYTAQYVNNGVKATFSFVGRNVDVEDKTVTIKKGTTPPDIFSSELTELGITILDITPGLADISRDTTFTVTVDKRITPSYTITYHTNGGSAIEETKVQEGSMLIAPAVPERTGYIFGGWFTDEAFTKEFDFEDAKMPGYALNLYAKWIGKNYEVTFHGNEGNLSEDVKNPITVTYGDAYGTLPTPTRTGYKFLGWFTSRINGEQIRGTDRVELSSNITLYAQWQEKQTISADSITYASGQGCTYDRKSHGFVFEASAIDIKNFKVFYKRQTLDNDYGTEAMNAGTYDVKLVYPEDGTYKYFETFLTGVYTIAKAESSIIKAPVTEEVYYANVLPEKMVVDTDYIGDGAFQYAVTGTEKYVVSAPGEVPVIIGTRAKNPVETDWVTGHAVYNLCDTGNKSTDRYLWVRLAEGENYLASEAKVSVEKIQIKDIPKSLFSNTFGENNLTYKLVTHTMDVGLAGTNEKIYAKIGNGSYVHLDDPNDKDDNERNDTNTHVLNIGDGLYGAMSNIPVTIKYDESGHDPNGWGLDWIRIDIYKDDQLVMKGTQYSVNHSFTSDSKKTFILTGYERKIKEYENVEQEFVTELTLTRNMVHDWTWGWRTGSVLTEPIIEAAPRNDNAYWNPVKYNPYLYLNAPELSVSFNDTSYNKYLDIGLTNLNFSYNDLYKAMVANQTEELQLTIKLEYKPVNGQYSVKEEDRTRTQVVTITCPDVAKSNGTVSSDITYQLSQSARAMFALNRGQLATVASVIQAGENGTFDVVYRMDENAGIWATKFAVEFDTEKVELQKYTYGNVFTKAEVMAPDQNTIAAGRYVFLASKGVDGQKFTDIVETGTLVTLTFKIKDKHLTDYPVTLDTEASQSINAASGIVTTKVNDNAAKIRVSGNTEAMKKEDIVAISVSGGRRNIEKVQVQKDAEVFSDITSTYAEGYRVIENGTYTFEVITEDGGKARTSITYTNLDNKKPIVNIDASNYTENTWTTGIVKLKAENTVNNLGLTAISYRLDENGDWKEYQEAISVGAENTATDVTYYFKAVSESGVESDVITYCVKVDNSPPNAEIQIGQNNWHTFLNNIFFGIFFKETQKVEINATDDGSGIAKISYYLSNRILTAEEVTQLSNEQWVQGDSFSIESDNRYVIYAKIIDKVGNSTIINSEGLVLDCTVPVVSGIENNQTYCTDVEVTISDENIKDVTLNGRSIELVQGKFTVGYEEGEQEIVVTDIAGNSTIYTITVNNKHIFTEYDSDDNATCITPGTKTATCEFCSMKDTVDDVGTKEHTWDEGKVTKEATTTEKGIKIYTCVQCGKTKMEEIERLPSNVQTGDESNMFLWFTVLIVSAAGIIGSGFYVKRKKLGK